MKELETTNSLIHYLIHYIKHIHFKHMTYNVNSIKPKNVLYNHVATSEINFN